MKFNINEFLKSLRRSYSPFDEQTGEWTPIDTDHSEELLKTKQRAIENGKKNLPKPAQKSKDAIALDIDAYLDSCISIGKTKLINRINTIDALNDSQLDKREQGDMHSEYETASTELKTLVMSSLNKLFNKKKRFKKYGVGIQGV